MHGRLSEIYVETTKKCNLQCGICYLTGMKNKDIISDADRDIFFPVELYEKLLDDTAVFDNHKGIRVNLTGGEPLLNPDIYKILTRSRNRAEKVFLFTNGTIFSGNLIEAADKGDIYCIVFSVDGTKKNHDLIRGRGTFKKTMGTIKKMRKKICKKTPLLAINTVINKTNINDLEESVLLAQRLKIDILAFSFIQWISRDLQRVYLDELKERIGHSPSMIEGFPEDLGILNEREIKNLIAAIKKIRGRMDRLKNLSIYFFPDFYSDEEIKYWFSDGCHKINICDSLFNKIRIYPNGDVYPVCGIPFYKIGNIKENSLSYILNSDNMMNLRKEVQERGYFYLCQRCCRRSPDSRILA